MVYELTMSIARKGEPRLLQLGDYINRGMLKVNATCAPVTARPWKVEPISEEVVPWTK
jgi:hypothetical protein